METIEISVFNLVGSNFCVEAEDGQKVFRMITKALNQNKSIRLSFLNVDILTTAFLNTAIGQLYKDFDEKTIKQLLSVSDMTASGLVALKRVVETAKAYYKDPEAMMRSVKEILGE